MKKIDAIIVVESFISNEEIIQYTLNKLSTTFQAIKTTTRANLQSITLDDLYSLLCN